MIKRVIKFSGLAVFPVFAIACGGVAPHDGLSDVHCGIGEDVDQLELGSAEVRVETPLVVDDEVQDALNSCLPSTRPLYSKILRLDGELPGYFDVYVGASELFWVFVGTQTELSDGEKACEPSMCSTFSDSYAPCASVSGENGGGEGGDGALTEDSCANGSSGSRYQNAVRVGVTAESIPTLRIVSAHPLTATLRVVRGE